MKGDGFRPACLGLRQEWFLRGSFSVATEGGALEPRPRGSLSERLSKQAFAVRKRTFSREVVVGWWEYLSPNSLRATLHSLWREWRLTGYDQLSHEPRCGLEIELFSFQCLIVWSLGGMRWGSIVL